MALLPSQQLSLITPPWLDGGTGNPPPHLKAASRMLALKPGSRWDQRRLWVLVKPIKASGSRGHIAPRPPESSLETLGKYVAQRPPPHWRRQCEPAEEADTLPGWRLGAPLLPKSSACRFAPPFLGSLPGAPPHETSARKAPMLKGKVQGSTRQTLG